MTAREPATLAPDTAVHRIGGNQVGNLRLRPSEESLAPPGISVLLGGTPEQAAEQMRHAFPDVRRYARIHHLAETVASSVVAEIERAGFRVIADPSVKFPNHARLIHEDGIAGFAEDNLEALARAFQDTVTPRK